MAGKLCEYSYQEIPASKNPLCMMYKVAMDIRKDQVAIAKIMTPYVSPFVDMTVETLEPSVHAWVIPGGQKLVTLAATTNSDCKATLHLRCCEGRTVLPILPPN